MMVGQIARLKGCRAIGIAGGPEGGWVSSGKIKNRVDVQEGLEKAPATLNRLFTSANVDKQLLKAADP
ncbi:hypothetical protein ACMHYB_11120 [Sorangium sp. So ce1128]